MKAHLSLRLFQRNKRERYREFVSDTRLRHKFIKQLAHFSDFDSKYRLPLQSNKLSVDNIGRELRKRDSPSVIFVISEDPRLDQKELPLAEALRQVVGNVMGTVLCCILGASPSSRQRTTVSSLNAMILSSDPDTSVSLLAASTTTAMLNRMVQNLMSIYGQKNDENKTWDLLTSFAPFAPARYG